MDFRDIVRGIQDVGTVLVKRGTAMGPLVPTLLLVPGFIFEDKLPLQSPESNPTQKDTRTDDDTSSDFTGEKATP